MKEWNGCEKDSTIPGRWDFFEEGLRRCPLKLITGDVSEYMEAYNDYKIGILPVAGGKLDQANTFVQAMRIIDREVAKVAAEVKKEMRQSRGNK